MIYLNYYVIFELISTKAILVLIMGYIHGKYSRMHKELENDNRNNTDTYYRIWNEACLYYGIYCATYSYQAILS